LESAERTLPTALALGWAALPKDAEPLLTALQGKWKDRDPAGKPRAKAKEFRDLLDDAKVSGWDKQLTRLQFSAWVLRQLKTDDDFQWACEVLAGLKIENADAPPPVEVHLALLLNTDRKLVPGGVPFELVRRALAVSQRAEEAALGLDLSQGAVAVPYPYSEQVLPWIREIIRKGDE